MDRYDIFQAEEDEQFSDGLKANVRLSALRAALARNCHAATARPDRPMYVGSASDLEKVWIVNCTHTMRGRR